MGVVSKEPTTPVWKIHLTRSCLTFSVLMPLPGQKRCWPEIAAIGQPVLGLRSGRRYLLQLAAWLVAAKNQPGRGRADARLPV